MLSSYFILSWWILKISFIPWWIPFSYRSHAVITFMYKFLWGQMISLLLGIYPGMEFLGWMVILWWIVWETASSTLFSKVTGSFYSLPAMHETSNFYIFLTKLLLSDFLISHPSGCEVVSQSGFDSLMNDKTSFMCLLSICVFFFFFGEISLHILCLLLNWVCIFYYSVRWVLHIF